MPNKVVTVVGARPQFIKAAPVSVALRAAGHREIIVHTGQHYDREMSAVFFDELGLPAPDYELGVGSGSHGAQTGAMLASIEGVLVRERPGWVLVYGDTNSTLAGALAAVKLHLPVAHVEAGLRSFDRRMPEELNRVLVDHVSSLLLTPSDKAVENLAREGIRQGVHVVGDVMADALMQAVHRADTRPSPLAALGVVPGRYLLVTVHRAQNTEDLEALQILLDALQTMGEPAVFPVHPRTRPLIERLVGHAAAARWRESGRAVLGPIMFTPPLGYLDMVSFERHARVIVTDSGGVQKEAYWLRVPCVTLRPETEWTETVNAGWNRLAPLTDRQAVCAVIGLAAPLADHPPLYGQGDAALRIAALL